MENTRRKSKNPKTRKGAEIKRGLMTNSERQQMLDDERNGLDSIRFKGKPNKSR